MSIEIFNDLAAQHRRLEQRLGRCNFAKAPCNATRPFCQCDPEMRRVVQKMQASGAPQGWFSPIEEAKP